MQLHANYVPNSKGNIITKAPPTKNMLPVIWPESSLLVRPAELDEIEYGKAYVIIYDSGKCEMYFIRKADDDDYWLCRSLDSNSYDPFLLKISRVRAVFQISYPII